MIDLFMAWTIPIQKGGWVAWVLVVMALWLWYLLAIRWLAVAAGEIMPNENLIKQLSHSIVVVAPLLGLLGTVIGMIETFDSLQDQAMYTQGGGIAAGISQALITTQLGLMVAIPGLLVGRQLDRKQEILEENIGLQTTGGASEVPS